MLYVQQGTQDSGEPFLVSALGALRVVHSRRRREATAVEEKV
jgi:hypothetical protein